MKSKNNDTLFNLNTGGMMIKNGTISISQPDNKTVNWNPQEYEVLKVDLEQGNIVFKKIENAE